MTNFRIMPLIVCGQKAGKILKIREVTSKSVIIFLRVKQIIL
jgi:hypothetical protein